MNSPILYLLFKVVDYWYFVSLAATQGLFDGVSLLGIITAIFVFQGPTGEGMT